MKRAIGTVVLAAGLMFFSTGLAQAATLEGVDKNVGALTLEATKKTSIAHDDELCEQAREMDDSEGTCGTQTVLETSKATVVDISKVSPTELALKSADGTTLAQAAARGTIYYKTWSQVKRGLYYVNWKEQHSGRFYYNGSRVWSTTSTLGYKGKHICDQGYGVLYDVKVTNCMTDVISSAKIQEWDYFRVHVVWKGIPLYVSHNMHATMTKTGGLS
ncbi:hypothetical protein [Paeniglutamicibacter antarcticus]|uniref:Uncharacterized protein n=1 Tax=Paeniglutamicibacter antarcticus TaxID=494023 RepID=A0ABP9TLA8_9MICC